MYAATGPLTGPRSLRRVTASQPHSLTASQPHSLTASQPSSLTAYQPSSLTLSSCTLGVVFRKPTLKTLSPQPYNEGCCTAVDSKGHSQDFTGPKNYVSTFMIDCFKLSHSFIARRHKQILFTLRLGAIPVSQPANQPVRQLINQPVKQLVNMSTSQSTSQLASKSVSQTYHQPASQLVSFSYGFPVQETLCQGCVSDLQIIDLAVW